MQLICLASELATFVHLNASLLHILDKCNGNYFLPLHLIEVACVKPEVQSLFAPSSNNQAKKMSSFAGALMPINFAKWVEENSHLLQPPINNKCVFSGKDFFVMAIGGPNNRTDYHVNRTEEWFYQVKGDMVLKVVDESTTPPTFVDIPVKEGEMYLLPACVPHSPQRFADTIGIVIERTRVGSNAVEDRMRWYCQECKNIVYEEAFLCLDVATQLKEIINNYHASDKTCKHCGAVAK